MTTPYVYLIGWTALDTWYCGVRYKKNCGTSDLWTTYFTSSKYVAKFRALHGEPDHVEILSTFSDAMDARLFEQEVLTRNDAVTSSRWLNRAVGGHFAGTRGPLLEATKQKISAAHKGKKRKPLSLEQIAKQKATYKLNYTPERYARKSQQQKGRVITEEHRQKISATLIGRTIPAEVRSKISQASKNQSVVSRQKQAAILRTYKWFTDGKIAVRAAVCPSGFTPGRPKKS